MKLNLIILISLMVASLAAAEPTVLVLPFDPIVDSLYGFHGGKESVLNYRTALQQIVATELGRREEIRVIEPARVSEYLHTRPNQAGHWNDTKIASEIASAFEADYAVIGTYGEFTKEIRIDARVMVGAMAEVPPGNTVTATVSLWEDLPTAASRIAQGVLSIVTQSGLLRPTSKALLFPEGDLSAYDPNNAAVPGSARLVVWVNAPAPQISSTPERAFSRCSRIDLMNITAEKVRTHSCSSAELPAGTVNLTVTHRGFLPYRETLHLASGKAYRLEVDLKPVERLPR